MGEKVKWKDVFESNEVEAGAGGADLFAEGVLIIDFAYLEKIFWGRLVRRRSEEMEENEAISGPRLDMGDSAHGHRRQRQAWFNHNREQRSKAQEAAQGI